MRLGKRERLALREKLAERRAILARQVRVTSYPIRTTRGLDACYAYKMPRSAPLDAEPKPKRQSRKVFSDNPVLRPERPIKLWSEKRKAFIYL